MAIVEDEVRNESEEENEIEVVVEEDDGEQDSEDSDDDDEDEALESKVAELERRIAEDPYNYEDHIDLIQALWGLSELERWRTAFNQLQQISVIKAEHWLLRIQTEVSLAHSQQARERINELFEQATLDCYSIQILSEWCSYCMGASDISCARATLDEVLRRGGADPLSGKIFWDAKAELEKSQLENITKEDPKYKEQQERVLFCLEEIVSRPLLHNDETMSQLQEVALSLHDDSYLDKIKKQHDAATEFLKRITHYEDVLLTLDDVAEKAKIYQDYISTVKDLAKEKRYSDCDTDGILKVLYDRATTDCLSSSSSFDMLQEYAKHVQAHSSRSTCTRVFNSCARRCPRKDVFWSMLMRLKEKEGGTFDEVKSILETALTKGLESFHATENIWLTYLEYVRRHTTFDNEQEIERLRRTFRLAWDTLAESWGAEANDCEIPLFWARLEYKRISDHKQGKEIFEEIFKYGDNKTMTKYWEALINLETSRSPPLSENKLRDLYKRAMKFVTDYPPSIVKLYKDFERDFGSVDTMRYCIDECEPKIKEWRENYQVMKDKMAGQKQKGKHIQGKKSKFDNKKEEKSHNKNKRKSDEKDIGTDVKKKKDSNVDVDMLEKDASTSSLKRLHPGEDENASDSKRKREDSVNDMSEADREACTLFVSNLEFKVNEKNLRDKLSEYGDIVSLRLKAGVKAFGGSICYCQYKSSKSVDEAVKHDRTPLDGRPMFLSRYAASKGKQTQQFKYSTEAEKNKLFVKNLAYDHCTKEALSEVFEKYGKLKDVRIVTFKDGKPKGLAYIEYDDVTSAENALSKTNGLLVGDRNIDVAYSAPPPRNKPDTLGQPKREITGGMRRTQLSSFIPSVLQRATTSANGNSNGSDKKVLSNSDFRNMLLKK